MPRVDPQQIIDDWLHATQGELLEPPPYVRAAQDEVARLKQIEQQTWFEWEVADLQKVIAAATQLQLKLPEMNERARARELTAQFLDRVVAPRTDSPSIHKLAPRLRSCRRRRDTAILPNGKMLVRWDEKAGVPLLCPDDARDEANRVQRRYVPAIMEAVRSGYYVYSCVFTIDNAPRGKLAQRIGKLHRKLRSIVRACKRADRPFPIIGGISVLEAPLGGYRDWHPHLNVILICDGYLEYEKLRARWGCNAHFEKIQGSLIEVKAAVRELLKYPVRTIAEKSEEKSKKVRYDRQGNEMPAAPAMVDWTAGEWLEWWRAHRGLRRTRTFGCLYKVPKPDKLDSSGAIWLCSDYYNGARYVRRFPLLEFIPGDKSTTLTPADIREAIRKAQVKLLGPPDEWQGAARAHEVIERAFRTLTFSAD